MNIPSIKTLLLLFGGRPQPNAMLAAVLQPQRIIGLVSKDSPYTVGEVLEGIASFLNLDMQTNIQEERVDPYDTRQIQEVLSRVSFDAVGATGAPVPMVVTAYEFGRDDKIPVYYVNTQRGEILNLRGTEYRYPLTLKIDTSTYLGVYRLEIEPPEPDPPYSTSLQQREQAARLLGQHGQISGEVLGWLRATHQSSLRFQKQWTSSFKEQHWILLQQLQKWGLLKVRLFRKRKTPVPHSRIEITFPLEGERGFLFGKWLEVYTRLIAEKLTQEGLLDDVRQGLRFRVQEGKRELDFFALYKGMALLGSCKARRKPWKKDYLNELSAVADLLGGRYTYRFFLTDQSPPRRDNKNALRGFQEFVAHAQRLRIRVVTGEELPRWKAILRQEIKNPTYPLI
ncbi:MAG: DUF1887 family protein [Candidatus Diapherotrites archaeon]|nr:DUF1887 family protein [Candidatus Diapherotrites archaeon]